jgi:hypothetical protein
MSDSASMTTAPGTMRDTVGLEHAPTTGGLERFRVQDVILFVSVRDPRIAEQRARAGRSAVASVDRALPPVTNSASFFIVSNQANWRQPIR